MLLRIDKGRIKFDTFVRFEIAQMAFKETPPETGLVYDFFFDVEQARWIPWIETQPEFRIDPKLTFNEIVVPTVDSIRYTYLLDILCRNNNMNIAFYDFHVLFTGEKLVLARLSM